MIKLKTDKLSLETYTSYLEEGILVEHAPGSTKVYQDALAAHEMQSRINKVLAMKPHTFKDENLVGLTSIQTNDAKNSMLKSIQNILKGEK